MDFVSCLAIDTTRSKHEPMLGSCSPSLWYVGNIALCPHIDNIFFLEEFAHNFLKQLVNVINSKPLQDSTNALVPKHNQIKLDRYSDIKFLPDQINKQYQKFYYAWNHNSAANDTTSQQKRILLAIYISYMVQLKVRIWNNPKECGHSNAKPRPSALLSQTQCQDK